MTGSDRRFPASKRVTEAALKCSVAAAAVALARLDGQPMTLVRALNKWHSALMRQLARLSGKNRQASKRKKSLGPDHYCSVRHRAMPGSWADCAGCVKIAKGGAGGA